MSGMEIGPGDTVLLPIVMGMTDRDINDLREGLADAFPGVRWSIQPETMITNALVYRAPTVEQGNAHAAEISRLRGRLATTVDVLDAALRTFTVMNSRSTYSALSVSAPTIDRWRKYVEDTRDALSTP